MIGPPLLSSGAAPFIVKTVSQALRARRGAWEIARRDDPGSNQLDVPNQDELRAVLAARHLNGCPSSTVYTEELLDERADSSSRFWAETETFREERGVRDIETIDAELRLIVRAWRIARVVSERIPSTAHIDELLDERAAALDREGFFSSLSSRSRPAASSRGSGR